MSRSNSRMRKRPDVGLLVETSTAYGREIIEGITTYLRTHGEWSIYLEQREERSPLPDWLLKWEGDGIICRWTTPELAQHLRKMKIPVVDLNDRFGYLKLPRVGSDMIAIGRMAAEHLLERGFRNIAYCGFTEMEWSLARRRGVEDAVSGVGNFCGALESDIKDVQKFQVERERKRIVKWLKTLPIPVGIVTCNDVRGYHVLDALRGLDLVVPEEVAVVGVDNSATYCNIATPPLSSVRPNTKRVGIEAAALLDRMMSGQKPEEPEKLVPPIEVVTRQSSDVLAVPDPLIARAIQLIRKHACDGWRVEDVLSALSVPRPILERGFRRYLDRSPHEELRRVRLKRVKQLLSETDWTLERIAERAGFDHPEYMMVQFKRVFGITPTQWRLENSVDEFFR